MAFSVKDVVVQLTVGSVAESIGFYRDVVGFRQISGDDTTWAMLALGGATIMLSAANPALPEGVRTQAPPSGEADSTLFFSVTDPDDVLAHLQAKGWPVSETSFRGYGIRQVWTADPDGFPLCFQCPATRPF